MGVPSPATPSRFGDSHPPASSNQGDIAISLAKLIPLDPAKVVETVIAALDDVKAEDVIVIDLRGRSTIADHLVVASGRSTRQVAAMADHLAERLKHLGLHVSVEGMAQCDWVLIDGGDIVVHLFRPEVRAFYNLERMWGVNGQTDTAASMAAVP